MRHRALVRTGVAVAVLTAAGLALTACDPDATDGSPASAATGRGRTAAGAPRTTTAAPVEKVPRFVGMGLQSAQDAAEAAGFARLTSHDSAGRDRMQILDRDWKVCSQRPAAGTAVRTDTKLDFGAVKTGEDCPAHDQAPPAKAGKTMPNFLGKALGTATRSLASGTSVRATDATGDRIIVLESNWKVCAQSPVAGAPLTGQPVKFEAVKFGENCP